MGGVQGGGIKALVARFGERPLVITGCLLLAVAFYVLPLTHSVALTLGVLALAAVSRGIAQPPMMGLASLEAGAGGAAQGVVLGTFQSSASLARVVGPPLAGLYDVSQILPFHLAGGLLLLAGLLAVGLPSGQGRAPR
jgi:MFS family permease